MAAAAFSINRGAYVRRFAFFLFVICSVGQINALDERQPSASSGTDSQEKQAVRMVKFWRRALARHPERVASYRGLARVLEKTERYTEAIEILQQALGLNPVDDQTYDELGDCYYSQHNYRAAANAFEHSLWYRPPNMHARLWLGYSLYNSHRYKEAAEAFEIVGRGNSKNFAAYYWRGICLVKVDDFEAGADALAHAVELRPNDFEANYWRGFALSRAHKIVEAIPNLEKAIALQPDSVSTRTLLAGSYLTAGQFSKAFHLFPKVSIVLGIILLSIYFLGVCAAWLLSFRRKYADRPTVPTALLWLMITFEGQAAFLFLPALLPALESSTNLIWSLLLPGLPLVFAALLAARRQRWGESFRWPLRFGGGKSIGLAILFLFVSFLLNNAVARMSSFDPLHRPVQKSMLILKGTLASHPILSLFAIVVFIPMVEEILFRGLLFTALRKRLRIRWVIPMTALLFALVHLDLAFFLPVLFLGLILGWARARSESLGLPILIHVTNNCLAMLATMLMERP